MKKPDMHSPQGCSNTLVSVTFPEVTHFQALLGFCVQNLDLVDEEEEAGFDNILRMTSLQMEKQGLLTLTDDGVPTDIIDGEFTLSAPIWAHVVITRILNDADTPAWISDLWHPAVLATLPVIMKDLGLEDDFDIDELTNYSNN